MKLTIKKRIKLLKRSAAKRNISVNLNEGFYTKLLSVGCLYCGKNLHDETGYCLDRYDNSKGYTTENSSPCCFDCNISKGKRDHWEYIEWIKKSYEHQTKVINSILKQQGTLLRNKTRDRKFFNKVENNSYYRNSENVVIEGSR